MAYNFKTTPYDHQLKALKLSANKRGFALLMEMGTGKSKVIIDNAGFLFNKQKIQALVIIAPSGVHNNWIVEEIPAHLSKDIKKPVLYVWKRSASKKSLSGIAPKDYNRVMSKKNKSLRIIAINIEAISTKYGFMFLKEVMQQFDTMLVADESHRIKNHKAACTKKALQLARLASCRRILSGTPVLAGAIDLYSQFEFLYPKCLGFSSYYSYKARYAILKEMERKILKKDASGKDAVDEDGNVIVERRWKFKKVVGYRHIEELKKRVDKFAYRVRKDECLDLPPKVYSKVVVQLTAEQRKIYDQLKEELFAELEQGEITVQNALTKLLRLQQIIGGFIPLDEGETIAVKDSPKLIAVQEIIEQVDGKVIIWARFRDELAAIARVLREEYGEYSTVEYHGGISKDARVEGVGGFNNIPAIRFFVGQPRSGGIGLTLNAASNVIYYSNDFSLDTRLQSEDRCHRIGQNKTVTYFDIAASGTIDAQIIRALKSKKSFSDTVLNDPVKEWL